MPAPKDPEKYATWRKGIQDTCNSPAVKARMSAAKKGKPGRKKSKAERAKIAESNRRRTYSDATRAKISQARRASPVQHRGVPHSPATRIKQRDARLSYWDNLTDEQRQEHLERLRLGRAKQWSDLTDEQRAARVERTLGSMRMQRVSSLENEYAKFLDAQNILYVQQWKVGIYKVDFFIPSEMKATEIAGCYWHCCEQCGFANARHGQREKDARRFEYLQKQGYTVEVIWEHDLSKTLKQQIAS